MVSVDQAIPHVRCLAIEYPGYVSDVAAVIDSLSGCSGISQAHTSRDDGAMQVLCRTRDPLAHPLFGSRQRSRSILLRLARPVHSTGASSSASSVTASIVAIIPVTYRFSSLADYQYVAAGRNASLSAEERMGPFGVEEEPMLLVPPTFSPHDQPLDYAFRNSRTTDGLQQGDGQQAADGLHTLPVEQLPLHMVSFDADQVPAQVEGVTEGLSAETLEGLQIVSEAFGERPVWSTQHLEERGASISAQGIEAALRETAYVFQKGPWKGLWLRRGYDPRNSATSDQDLKLARGYQALELKLPAKWAERGANSGLGGGAGGVRGSSLEDVHRFAALPGSSATGTIHLQLCDLRDELVEGILRGDIAKLPLCRLRTGWLTQKEHSTLQQHVKARFQALAEGSGPPQTEGETELLDIAGPQPHQDGSVSVGGFLASILAEEGM